MKDLKVFMQVGDPCWKHHPQGGLKARFKIAPAAPGKILRIVRAKDQGGQALDGQSTNLPCPVSIPLMAATFNTRLIGARSGSAAVSIFSR